MPIDYSEYPKNWKELRAQVLERANNCCENCGVENHRYIHRFGKGVNEWKYYSEGMQSEVDLLDGKKPTKIILTIAHLDHDKENHNVSIDRLRAWCQKCHLQYDLPRHIANRKYGRNHGKNNYKIEF